MEGASRQSRVREADVPRAEARRARSADQASLSQEAPRTSQEDVAPQRSLEGPADSPAK